MQRNSIEGKLRFNNCIHKCFTSAYGVYKELYYILKTNSKKCSTSEVFFNSLKEKQEEGYTKNVLLKIYRN